MCKAWEEQKKYGISMGLEQGIGIFIEDKIDDGFSVNLIIQKLMKSYKLSSEQAREYVDKLCGIRLIDAEIGHLMANLHSLHI